MRAGLVVFGIIFLVLGVAAYYYPSQTVSSSTFVIPIEWSYVAMAIGFLLLVFGLVIPAPVNGAVQGQRGPRGRSYRRASVRRRSRRIPRGTTVTTTRTTRTKR